MIPSDSPTSLKPIHPNHPSPPSLSTTMHLHPLHMALIASLAVLATAAPIGIIPTHDDAQWKHVVKVPSGEEQEKGRAVSPTAHTAEGNEMGYGEYGAYGTYNVNVRDEAAPLEAQKEALLRMLFMRMLRVTFRLVDVVLTLVQVSGAGSFFRIIGTGSISRSFFFVMGSAMRW